MPEITAVSIKDAGSIEFTGTSFQISGYTANATFGGVYADSVTVASDTSAVATWTKGVPVVKEATAPVLFFSKMDAFTVVPVTYVPSNTAPSTPATTTPTTTDTSTTTPATDTTTPATDTTATANEAAATKAKEEQDAAIAASTKALADIAAADAAAAKAKTE
jgi:hypothetical protein